jgi:hypothetical protein
MNEPAQWDGLRYSQPGRLVGSGPTLGLGVTNELVIKLRECARRRLRDGSCADLRSAAWSSVLTYQADRDNVRCDAGDCHEGARTAGAAHPASLR